MDATKIKVGDKVRLSDEDFNRSVIKIEPTTEDMEGDFLISLMKRSPKDRPDHQFQGRVIKADGSRYYPDTSDILDPLPEETSEETPIDATKIKVGDKVRLRNGLVKRVTEVTFQDFTTSYPVTIEWGDGDKDYTVDGVYWVHNIHNLDILEVIPAETSEEAPQDDIVVRPSHYTQFPIEPVEFVMKNDPEGKFAKGNIIKYTCRAGSKLYPGMDAVESEIIDLEKASRYAEMRIRQLKGEDIL